MRPLVVLIVLMCLLACNNSSGPSEVLTRRVDVVSVQSGSVVDQIDLDFSDVELNGTIIVDPRGEYGYVLSSLWNEGVIRVDLQNRERSGFNSVPDAVDIALTHDGDLLCVLAGDSLVCFDTETFTPQSSVALGGTFWDLEPRPFSDQVYAGTSGDTLGGFIGIDLDLGMVVTDLGYHPWSFCFSADGESVYLTQGGELLKVDPETGTLEASVSSVTGGLDMCLVEEVNRIFIADIDPAVQVFNASTLADEGPLQVPGGVNSMCCTPDGSTLFLSCLGDIHLAVFDPANLTQLGEVPMDPDVHSIAASPDGNYVYCSVWINGSSEE